MTDTDTAIAVRRSVTVNATPERAFEVFTAGFSTWWPLETHHIGKADAAEAVIEPRTGGRWFERGVDGSEYEFDPDPAQATEVEIRFTAKDGGTLVELEHRGFEKYGDAEKIRESVSQKGGWGDLLEMYAKAV
jgi:uncharacterized protein YndB with AHSA1/START domain